MKFGKYAIIEPVQHSFARQPEWYWGIKPPTSGDELVMAKFLNGGSVTFGSTGTSRELPPAWLDVCHLEIALTFGGTNIPKDDDVLVPVLPADASIDEVRMLLSQMPQEMVLEIWEAVGEAVPSWGPKKDQAPGKPSTQKQKSTSKTIS
jgi:hypothetical protein